MQIIGFIIAILIGVVLGLVGGGGAILTVPLVHYIFGKPLLVATSFSLFIVTIAALTGVLQRLGKKEIAYREALIFVIPSMLTALFIRGIVLPASSPEFEFFSMTLKRDNLLSGLLALLLFLTAYRLFQGKKGKVKTGTYSASTPKIILFGAVTGLLSGLLGSGGGFIIVPILLSMRLGMKQAVATSMFIIFIQSGVALIGDFFNEEIRQNSHFNWSLLITLTGLTIIGVYIGTYLHRYFSGKILRKLFAVLLISVGLGISWSLI